jgi:Asp/Glu/hydantoin racemase
MRLLLINPNTTEDVTDRLAAAARTLAPPGTEVVAATGGFGSPYIASRASAVVGAHAALELARRHVGIANPHGYDAVLMACFGEPGIEALREELAIPVLGMAECSFAAALRLGPRFGVVTGGHAWGPMLREFAAVRGMAQALAAVRTLALDGGAIARDPDSVLPALAEAARLAHADGADSVILGGAGLVGLAARLPPMGFPVLDCLDCLITAALALPDPRATRIAGNPAPP